MSYHGRIIYCTAQQETTPQQQQRTPTPDHQKNCQRLLKTKILSAIIKLCPDSKLPFALADYKNEAVFTMKKADLGIFWRVRSDLNANREVLKFEDYGDKMRQTTSFVGALTHTGKRRLIGQITDF